MWGNSSHRSKAAKRVVAVLGVVLVVGGGIGAFKVLRSHAACQSIRSYEATTGKVLKVSTGAPTVAVLGDSWSSGDMLQNRKDAWVYEFGRNEGTTTNVAAVGGTGYVNGGFCGDGAFSARVGPLLASHPDSLIVEGGLNDLGVDTKTLGAAVDRVLAEAASVPRVAVIGPVDVPGRVGEAAVDRLLADRARAHGYRYVSALTWPVAIGSDGSHMTKAGHADYARRVEEALSD